MFPTDPIRNYISLSFAKKIDDLAREYAAEANAARLNFPNPGGIRLRAIMEPSVQLAKARAGSFIQIVRDACKEANRPVDDEVRAYMLTEIHSMCEGSRVHTLRLLDTVLQQEAMQHVPGVRESLSARLDHQILQIESGIRRELKLEELRENVQKSARQGESPSEAPVPRLTQGVDEPVEISTSKGTTTRNWTGPEKWGTGIAAVTLLMAVIALLSSHDFRVWARIERSTPRTDGPKVRADELPTTPVPAPMPNAGKTNPYPNTKVKAGSDGAAPPKVNNAPNGIINDGGTMVNPTVNNFAPLEREVPADREEDFKNALKTSPNGHVSFVIAGSSEDAGQLENQLTRLLHGAGWTKSNAGQFIADGETPQADGLQCYSTYGWNTPEAKAFHDALEAGGLVCTYLDHAYSFHMMTFGGITLVIGRNVPARKP